MTQNDAGAKKMCRKRVGETGRFARAAQTMGSICGLSMERHSYAPVRSLDSIEKLENPKKEAA